MADLNNPTGIELQLIFSWQGAQRYINNDYRPISAVEDWDFEAVMDDWATQWLASPLAAAMHTTCTLHTIKGRVRGRPDAGMVINKAVSIVGTVTGNPTPSWLVGGLVQEPDNANRRIVIPGTTIFRKGRISMPGVPTSFVAGNGIAGPGISAYEAVIPFFLGLSEGVVPADNPGFELVMNRNTPAGLAATANVLEINVGELGTQLTARH